VRYDAYKNTGLCELIEVGRAACSIVGTVIPSSLPSALCAGAQTTVRLSFILVTQRSAYAYLSASNEIGECNEPFGKRPKGVIKVAIKP